MTQISKRFLKPEVEEKIKSLFFDCLARCHSQGVAESFIDSLLTETEKVMIAKRVAIALMLLKGRTSVEVQNTLKVSGQTVWTVGMWLRSKGAGYQTLLKEVIKRDEEQEKSHREALADTESSALWFGKTDWKAKRAQQWKRVKESKVPF